MYLVSDVGRGWHNNVVSGRSFRPYRDSGTLKGKRTTGGGRVEFRNGLFMPIIVAKQYNPTIKAFYDQLIANG